MADAELAVSLAMVSLLDLLSKSKDIIADQSLTDQISRSITSLQTIMNRRHAYPNHQPDDHHDVNLQARARDAEMTAQQLLVQLLRDYLSKSQLDRFFSGTDRVCARKNMATEFRERVISPFQQLEPPPPVPDPNAPPPVPPPDPNAPPPEPLLFSERVESHIVCRHRSVNLLVTNLIGPTTPRPVPPPPVPDPNAPPPPVPPPPVQDANAPPPPPPPPVPDPNAPPPPVPPPPVQDANAPPPPPVPDPNAPPPPVPVPDPNAPPPPVPPPPVQDANAPPPPVPAPPVQDANAPPLPPVLDANAPPPPVPVQDPNAPPPPVPPPPVQDANAPPPPVPVQDANAPPPPVPDPNAPPRPVPPPPVQDANAPPLPPVLDANAPPPPVPDPNAPPPVPPPDPNTPLQVIAVVGRENCGKTALVRSVFNMLIIKHHFDCRAWVHVTGLGVESWTESLLVDILLQMPIGDQLKDLKHKNKEQLFDMLYGLLMEKRYLIVLDNLGAQPFDDFLRPFADVNNGSRVIVTSTNEAMQNLVDPRVDDLQLCPRFTDADCRTLLRDSFTGGGGISEELVTSILVKCGGSAPAISLLGGLLSAVEENRRVALINGLGEPAPLEDVMRLCFHELPYQMKPCVLYMALFPKESEVPTRRLFRLWAAEGLLAEAAADESVRMRSAEDCFCELERRNLIRVVCRKPDTSARSCRMPAFLHKFFVGKAKAFGLLEISPDPEQNALHQPNQAQNAATGHYDYMVRYLRSVASFNTCKPGTQQAREIEDLLESPIIDGGPGLLRVLDLEGVYKPVLPKKFENILPNLRYLGLRQTALDSIPESVGNLLLLETLDLKHTNITKVTSAVWNAKNLRHLYLSEASFDGSIPRHILSGSKLETLWGLFIETDKSPMISVLPRLRSLKKLGVTCRPGAASAVARCISQLTDLKSLRLRSRDLFGQPAVLRLCNMRGLEHLSNLYLLGSLRPEHNPCSVLPLNLKRLTLSMSGCKGDPMPVLQSLKHLIDLRLLARSCSTKKLHCNNAGFPELLVLKIWMLEELEELKVEQGAMCNLKELDIRQCKELKEVTGLIHINSLKFVSLTRVKKVLEDSLARGAGVHQDALVKTTELLREDRPPARGLDIYTGGVPDETDED